ncbi:hypothetical protein LSCM1_04534 [Leishmania martiniquensis]|uniref:Uncharacterized protein n=1 Tax=Leishmania martiniquensis TaxID=1580590 RepID=A0A836KF40_9TRYP|nr:hypothetical protein LSCM1_04534 [Leishmania martiniquensis]
MQRFSHFLIEDSDSEKSLGTTLPAHQSANAPNAAPHRSEGHENAWKGTILSLQRNAENAAPTAEQPAAPPAQQSRIGDALPTSLPHSSLPTSPSAHKLAETAGPPPNSQESGSSAIAQLALPAPELAVPIDSAGADAAPPHAEGAFSDLLSAHKDGIAPPAAGASDPTLANSSDKRISSGSPGARVAAAQEEEQGHSIKETRRSARTAAGPVATANSASTHRKGSNGEEGKGVFATSSPAAALTAEKAAAGRVSAAADARRGSTTALRSSSDAGQQRVTAGAEAHPSAALPGATDAAAPAREVAGPPRQKKASAGCGLFGLCKRKGNELTAAPARDSAERMRQSAEVQTAAQASPPVFAAAGSSKSPSGTSLSIPVAPDAAVSKGSLTHSREANFAESKGEGEGKEVAPPQPAHESPAQAPAGVEAPEPAPTSKEAHNEILPTADANVEEGRRGSAHGTPPASSVSEGPDAAPREAGELATVAAGSGEAQRPASKEHKGKRAKVVVRRRRQEPMEGRGGRAGSADGHETSESGGDAQSAAYSGEAKTSAIPSDRGSLRKGTARAAAVAVSGPLIDAAQPLPRSRAAAVGSRSSASHSRPRSHNGSTSGSRSYSYSYSYSNSDSASKSPAESSAAPLNVGAARRSMASDASLQRSVQESAALFGVRSARSPSSASQQSHKPIGMFLEEEEPLLSMPAYWRRVLLDLRARERRDAEEAAREWRELTFRPQIHTSPFRNHGAPEPTVMTDRSHTPLSGVREPPAYSPASGFSESCPGRYQIRRISPRLLGPRCSPKQPAPPPFKPLISEYAKSIARPRNRVFELLYKARSSSPPALNGVYMHRPQITKLASQLYPNRRSKDGNVTPYRKSVFDRLYRLRRSPDSGPTTSLSRDAAFTPSFQPQITDMAHRQSEMQPRESFGDRLYRHSRPPGGEDHAPFHEHEDFRDDSGPEHAISEIEDSGSSSCSSRSSFAMRSARAVPSDLDRRFSQTQAAVEAL